MWTGRRTANGWRSRWRPAEDSTSRCTSCGRTAPACASSPRGAAATISSARGRRTRSRCSSARTAAPARPSTSGSSTSPPAPGDSSPRAKDWRAWRTSAPTASTRWCGAWPAAATRTSSAWRSTAAETCISRRTRPRPRSPPPRSATAPTWSIWPAIPIVTCTPSDGSWCATARPVHSSSSPSETTPTSPASSWTTAARRRS